MSVIQGSLISSYVFVKTPRVPGEEYDIQEDIDNFDIDMIDCTNEADEEWHVCSNTEQNLTNYCSIILLSLGHSLGGASSLLLLVQLLNQLLVCGSLHASSLHGRLLLRQQRTLVAQGAVSHQTLDLGGLISLVAVVLEHAADHELANVVLLRQTEQLADVRSSLRSQTSGLRGGLVGESGDLLLTLLHDHQVQHTDVGTNDATSHRLSLSLTLQFIFITR